VEMGFSCPDLLFVFFDAFLSLLGRRLASGFAGATKATVHGAKTTVWVVAK